MIVMSYSKIEKRALVLKRKLEAEAASKKKPKKSKAMENTTESTESAE